MGSMGPERSAARAACIWARASAGTRARTAATTPWSATHAARRGGHGRLETRPTVGLRSGYDDGVAGLEREVGALRAPVDQVRVPDRDVRAVVPTDHHHPVAIGELGQAAGHC